MLCAQQLASATEVRCASTTREWCRITEPVQIQDADKVTITNTDHSDDVLYVEWTRATVKTIPKILFEKFPKMAKIDMSTGLETLTTDDFEKATELETIDFTKNSIRRVPAGVFTKATKLVSIDMTYNRITTIEDNAFNGLAHLQTLSLDYNWIDSLKRNTFAGAPKLQTINLRNNEITSIEPGTFDLPRLDELDLAVNHLKSMAIPAELFVNAPVLRHVDLSYNELTTIPNAFRRSKVTVESIVLDYNPLDNFELNELCKLKGMKYVSLENTGFTMPADEDVPQKVCKSMLDNLDLTANGIDTANILNHLAMFGNLETITLDENHIHTINNISNVKDMFPNITSISLENNEVDCGWLRETLPTMKAAEVELATGVVYDKIPLAEQGEAVGEQLCGKVPE